MAGTPLDSTVRVGEVLRAEPFEEARKPELFKLWIDLGDGDGDGRGEVQSAAQLGFHHDVDELPGRQVLCATGLGTVNVAGFVSEVLTVGVPGEDGKPVLVTPEEDVPLGGVLY